ncbi:hypothetical protein ABPG75_012818 [Micractinium tetrahymenae]
MHSPALLERLRAAEHQLTAQGPEAQAAVLERTERAKALRPCAYLACPHLAGNPQPRSKRCAKCLTVRYNSTECQAQDWADGHRAACRLLRAPADG